MIWHRGWDQNKNTFWDKATFTPDPDSNLEEGPKTPFKAVSEIDHIKNGLQINDRMAENFADKTLIDDGNDEFFASLKQNNEENVNSNSSVFFYISHWIGIHKAYALDSIRYVFVNEKPLQISDFYIHK